MQVHVFENAQQVGKAAAVLFASQVMRKPDSILGLATGSSPIGCYQELIAMHQAGVVDFSQCVSYNLDEYCALPQDHACSYHTFMREELFDHINMKAHFVPDGNAADLAFDFIDRFLFLLFHLLFCRLQQRFFPESL